MTDPGQANSDTGGLVGSLAEAAGALKERLVAHLDVDFTEVDWLGEESARVGANLLALLESGWPEMLAIGGRVVGFSLVGACVVGLGAALAGWLLYLLVAGPVLQRGWRPGRLLGCVVATLTSLLAAAGGGWAGLWLGGGRALEQAIERQYVVERIAAATFLAFSLEPGEVPAELDPAATSELLKEAQRRSSATWDEFRTRANAAVSEAGLGPRGWLRAELLTDALERLAAGAAPDLVELHRVLSSPAAPDDTDPLPQTAEIRRRAVTLVRANAYPQAAASLAIGLGGPLASLLLFGFLGVFVNRGAAVDRPEAETEDAQTGPTA